MPRDPADVVSGPSPRDNLTACNLLNSERQACSPVALFAASRRGASISACIPIRRFQSGAGVPACEHVYRRVNRPEAGRSGRLRQFHADRHLVIDTSLQQSSRLLLVLPAPLLLPWLVDNPTGALMQIIDVTPDNVDEVGFYCVKSRKNKGWKAKRRWLDGEWEHGLSIKILQDDDGKQHGFIEYTTAEHAWRPVDAPGWMFIHCLLVIDKADTGKGYASKLMQACLEHARAKGADGMAVFTSDGAWLAGKEIFLKHGFEIVDTRERYELLIHRFRPDAVPPRFIPWEDRREGRNGWDMVYAHQCPLFWKSVEDLPAFAAEQGVEMTVTELANDEEARNIAPSGYGVYTLLHDGELVSDYYVSKGRFKNLVKKK
ncbi:GNAT family N-acetyltransferase [bacterium]|nr:GNAT family N-acetyltransferase [bacterium]